MFLCTWDIHGALSSIAKRKEEVTFSDLVFLSEHCLSENCLPILDALFDKIFISYAKPPKPQTITKGGEVVIVQKSENYTICKERILAINLTIGLN